MHSSNETPAQSGAPLKALFWPWVRIFVRRIRLSLLQTKTLAQASPLEVICFQSVRKLRLKPSCFEGAKEFLSYANINDATMFPDIQGLANYLRSLLYLGRLTI